MLRYLRNLLLIPDDFNFNRVWVTIGILLMFVGIFLELSTTALKLSTPSVFYCLAILLVLWAFQSEYRKTSKVKKLEEKIGKLETDFRIASEDDSP